MMELNDPRLDVQQAEKLKVAKWWRDEWRMMMDEWRMIKGEWRMIRMNDEGWWFQAVEGFCFLTDRQTDWWMNKQTDIGECRVAFATEK